MTGTPCAFRFLHSVTIFDRVHDCRRVETCPIKGFLSFADSASRYSISFASPKILGLAEDRLEDL